MGVGDAAKERLYFGISLIGRSAAADWPLVDGLLALTLRSVLAQADADYRVVLAGHDRPPAWDALAAGDARFAFIEADWTPEPPTEANDDGGRKKALIKHHVRERGGGLLMFLDADDWVDRRLVRAARARMGPGVVAALVDRGLAFDLFSRRAARFPVAGGFDGAFHRLCGSSVIARVDPAADDPVLRDPHAALGWHAGWDRVAAELGLPLVRLPLDGVYVVGTDRSHSERDGPHAAWRRAFAATVREVGRPLAAADWRRFGLRPELLPGIGTTDV